MSKWQPIETAPLNQSVLVYIPNAEHYGEGIYRALKKQSVGDAQIWMTTGLHHGSDIGGNKQQPTHWMRLPLTPEENAYGSGEGVGKPST